MNLNVNLKNIKHRTTGFLSVSLLILSSLSLPLVGAQPLHAAPLSTKQAQTIAQELREKLKNLGEFEAHYTAISPDKQSADIIITYNPKYKYVLARVDMPEDTRKWLVLDYAELYGAAQKLDIWLVTSEWKQRFEISLPKLHRQFTNPLGAAYLLAKNLPQAPTKKQLKKALQPGAVLLSLGLNATDLNLVMGVSTNPGALQSSWLNDDIFNQASDYKRTADQVTLTYPNSRSVSIDVSSGLLQRDSWPDAERPGPREIKLIRFGGLAKNKPYRELLPDLSTLPDGKLPTEKFETVFYTAFLTELAYSLQNSNALKDMKADVPATQALLLKRLRPHIQRSKWAQINAVKSKTYFQKLWSTYTHHKNEKQIDLSFEDFVQKMRASASNHQGNYSQILLPPGFQQALSKMQENTRQALLQMPEDARESMGSMLEIGMPKLWEAMLLESLDAYLDDALLQAKSSN